MYASGERLARIFSPEPSIVKVEFNMSLLTQWSITRAKYDEFMDKEAASYEEGVQWG